MEWMEKGGRFKLEETYVYLWLTHVDVWEKPTQFCKVIILELKNTCFKKCYNQAGLLILLCVCVCVCVCVCEKTEDSIT